MSVPNPLKTLFFCCQKVAAHPSLQSPDSIRISWEFKVSAAQLHIACHRLIDYIVSSFTLLPPVSGGFPIEIKKTECFVIKCQKWDPNYGAILTSNSSIGLTAWSVKAIIGLLPAAAQKVKWSSDHLQNHHLQYIVHKSNTKCSFMMLYFAYYCYL